MNEPTDQELSNQYSKVSVDFMNFFSGLSMEEEADFIKGKYKSYRDELFYRLLNGWNESRKQAGYKPLSKARLASAIARNPFLKKDDGELELLIKTCEQKGNYKIAHFTLFK